MSGDCPASGASSAPLSKTFYLADASSSITIVKTPAGRVVAEKLIGQPSIDLFLSELPTKRAVERLTQDWDLPQNEVIVGDEWLPELFYLTLFRFGYLGALSVQASLAEQEVADFLDLSGDMIFYLKSVWRGVKGSVCVPATSVLARSASEVSAPEPSLRRRAAGGTETPTHMVAASVPSVVVSNKNQKTLM
jgi:hypothetical protein